MKQQDVFKKIGVIIKELNEQYEYLKTVDGTLNELELELFLANSHFLTDHLNILSRLNAQSQNKAPEKPVTPHEQKFFEPLVQTPAPKTKPAEKPAEEEVSPAADDTPAPHIDLTGETPVENFTLERENNEEETIRHELILDDMEDWDEEDDTFDVDASGDNEDETELPFTPEPVKAGKPPVTEPEPVKAEVQAAPEPVKQVKPQEPKTEQRPLTINERMSASMGDKSRGIAGQPPGESISDLKQAINLNDKLLYTKDLFNGYTLAYTEAVEILNRFTSFDDADRFLKKNYVVKNNWESKPETSEKFYNLLRRRYA